MLPRHKLPCSIPHDVAGPSMPKIDWNILCKKLPEIKPTGTDDAQLNGHRELPAATGEEEGPEAGKKTLKCLESHPVW